MGEAKRKRERALSGNQIDFARLAAALKKLCLAASVNIGTDCFTHATLGQAVLQAHGVRADIVVGFAGWRVGDGDGDVILHAPAPNMPYQPGGVAYHVWLELDGYIFDATTYQLRQKAVSLDLLDGGCTTVDWCPDYLYMSKKSRSTLQAVTMGHAGMYYYQQVPDVERHIMSTAPVMDVHDACIACTLYDNPDVVILGPNDQT